MSSRQSKNKSHIWDNLTGVCSTTARRNPYYFNTHDTTGSSTSVMSILEYSREEITVVSPRPTCQPHHHHHPKEKRAQKPKHKDVYVTNREREQAEPPKTLATWKYQPMRKEKYNPNAVCDAFEAYQHRIRIKKWAEPKVTTHIKKRVTINETATEVVQDHCAPHQRKYQKLRVTNRRDDEIKIDNFTAKTVTTDVECVETEGEEHPEEIRIQKLPGFYGTIEAEQCAEQAAGYLSYASENLDRLRFVTEAVYPQSNDHLKVLHDIEEDVKEFNSQMRHRRVRVPASAGTQTQVAHFIIHDN